jgi:hypothetical protein
MMVGGIGRQAKTTRGAGRLRKSSCPPIDLKSIGDSLSVAFLESNAETANNILLSHPHQA